MNNIQYYRDIRVHEDDLWLVEVCKMVTVTVTRDRDRDRDRDQLSRDRDVTVTRLLRTMTM